jgi:hypothetical protein
MLPHRPISGNLPRNPLRARQVGHIAENRGAVAGWRVVRRRGRLPPNVAALKYFLPCFFAVQAWFLFETRAWRVLRAVVTSSCRLRADTVERVLGTKSA